MCKLKYVRLLVSPILLVQSQTQKSGESKNSQNIFPSVFNERKVYTTIDVQHCNECAYKDLKIKVTAVRQSE